MVVVVGVVVGVAVGHAKLAMKVAALKSLSTPAGVCEDLGKQMISYGRVMSTAELFARIDAIDAATVKDTVYQIVHDNDHVHHNFNERIVVDDFHDYND